MVIIYLPVRLLGFGVLVTLVKWDISQTPSVTDKRGVDVATEAESAAGEGLNLSSRSIDRLLCISGSGVWSYGFHLHAEPFTISWGSKQAAVSAKAALNAVCSNRYHARQNLHSVSAETI